jgi:TonB-dependent starch-binding outer membrane protein SusC
MKHFYQKTFGKILITSMLIFSVSVVFAQRKVSGKVTDSSNGDALPGASITVKGTSTGVTTDASGAYSISVPNNNATIVFSFVGYTQKEMVVGNQSTINVNLDSDTQSLQEVVVTGYQQIRKRDITGAVTVIEAEGLKSIKSSSFTQNLAGRAAGVTISTSGSPGDATNVRVRGISSFTSNDPLYVIDGVPVQDQYQNTINPDDIESIQVLKDASTASIYGSRASNGVIVITTKKGKVGKTKVTYNGSFGLVNSVKGFDEVLNTSSKVFAEAIKAKFSTDPTNTPVFAQNPSALPKYIQPVANSVDENTYDILNNQISITNQEGTNWWKEMTRTAKMQDHSINLSGGNEFATFSISGSYLKQEGVLNFTDYNRGTVRANSTYKVGKKVRIGENLMYAANWGVGVGSTGGNNNEQGVIGNLLKSTPVVPVYDIKGNPGGHLTAGTGNFTNPTQVLINNKDNTNKYNRFLGNFYGEYDIISGLTVRTSFGTDFGNGWSRRFTYPEPYRVEGNKTANSFNENWSQTFTWTWTNTVAYNKAFGMHSLNVLAGQEAISNKNRNINGNLANFFTQNVNSFYLQTALADPSSRQVSSSGSESRLASVFGKIDYAFNDKYLVSATIRRDGSSRFLSDVRYGIFPAVSVGWRVSQESFMKDLSWLSDLKLRASYGEVGNQNIRNYNFSDIYGGSVGGTFYDINGTNGGVATGYALTSRGNANTIWESAKTSNIGIDASFLNNAVTFVLDVYKRNTENLLFNPALPGTAGSAAPPFVNVGQMENTGFDLAVGYRKNVNKDLGFNASINLSHYKNIIKKVANNADEFYPNDNLTERLPQSNTAFINKVGYSISSFRGYIAEGLITTEAEKAKQVGSAIGGLKFKDLNGDGIINDADNTIIGSPHPKLTMGLNLGTTYKSFDLNAFIFGTYGNKIFNATKIQTYFMNFNSNVAKGVVENQGVGLNPKINGLDASSRSSSTFYVEDGSYTRLGNLQLGYRIPKATIAKLGLSSARVYLQGQNLFTITKYSGVDPAVSNANIGNSGNVNDLRSGYDNGNYPSNKITTLGLSLEF